MTVAAASDVEPAPARRGNAWVLLPLAILAIVALSVGLIARWQATSTGKAEGGYFDLFFSDPIHLKAWFATAAALLALGSAFFGDYAAKVLIIRMRRYAVWVIPTAGGLLFTTLIVVWYTSALWFFQIVGESI